MSDNVERYMVLQKKVEELKSQKIRLEEQHKNKKQALTEIVEKIKALGIEPNQLKTVIAEKENEIMDKLNSFEKEVEDVSRQLSSIQG